MCDNCPEHDLQKIQKDKQEALQKALQAFGFDDIRNFIDTTVMQVVENKKIALIKVVRQVSGFDLLYCKNFVDGLFEDIGNRVPSNSEVTALRETVDHLKRRLEEEEQRYSQLHGDFIERGDELQKICDHAANLTAVLKYYL